MQTQTPKQLSGDKLKKLLLNAPDAEELDLSGYAVSPDHMRVVKEELVDDDGVKKLNLSNAGITTNHLPHLGELMWRNPHIQSVDLRGNPLTSTDIDYIWESWTLSPQHEMMKEQLYLPPGVNEVIEGFATS